MATRLLLTVACLLSGVGPAVAGEPTWADAFGLPAGVVVVPPKPIETDAGGGGGFRGTPVASPDLVVDRWRTALGLDLPARRPGSPVVRPTRPAEAPAWSWRQAPDNPAVELWTDGRTWTAWRYRAGFAPVARPTPVTYAVPAYCPPGGT